MKYQMGKKGALCLSLLSLVPLEGCGSARVQTLTHGRSLREGATEVHSLEHQEQERTTQRRLHLEEDEGREERHEEWLLEQWGDSISPSGYRALRLLHSSARVAQSVRGEHLRSDTLRESGQADLGQALRATSSEAETREEKRRPSMGWIGGRTPWVIALMSVLSLGLVCWSRGWRLHRWRLWWSKSLG